MELTEGIAGKGKANSNRARMSQNLSPEMLFDLLAIQINGEKKRPIKTLIINIILTDTNEQATFDLKERRLIEPYRQAPSGPYRNFGRRQTSHLHASLMQPENIAANLQAHKLSVTGKLESLKELGSSTLRLRTLILISSSLKPFPPLAWLD